jgi:hypothetical protein
MQTEMTQNIRKRFNSVIDALLDSGEVESFVQFCVKIGVSSNHVRSVYNGYDGRNPTLFMVTEMVQECGVNANYIFSRSKIMFLKDIPLVEE